MFSARDFAPSKKRCGEVVQKLRGKDGLRCVYCGSKGCGEAWQGQEGLPALSVQPLWKELQ